MDVNELSTIENEIAANDAVMCYFFNDRCAPCTSLRPKVQEMIQNEFPRIHFLLIDSEQQPEITSHYGVFSNPTIVLFFDGREHQRWSKYVGVAQISDAINRPYQLLFGH